MDQAIIKSVMSELGKASARKRMATTTPDQRSNHARLMAIKRWEMERAKAAQKKQ